MSTRPSTPVTGIAISAVALGAAIALIVPMSASAAAPVSQGTGRLLTASIAGAPSTPLLNLAGATAIDSDGTSGPITSNVPLDATVLNALNLQAGPTDLFGPTGIIQLGAVGQFAQARNDGSSVAFSGTVSSAPGLVGAGTTVTGSNLGTPGAGNSASINLANVANTLSLAITVGAVAASASETAAGAQSGDYVIDNLNVVVGGSVIATVNALVGPTLDGVINTVNLATGGAITNPLTGSTITISLTDLLTAAGVTDINDLAPGTDLLSFLPQALLTKITATTNGLFTSLTTAAPALAAVIALAQTTVDGLLTGATGVVGAVSPLLAALATLPVNNKTSNADGSFTQNAITLNVLNPAGGASLASVQIANATVGPNTAPAAVTPGGPGTTRAALLAETGVTVPVGATLAGAGLLAAAGFGLTRLAAWRRRGTHRGVTSTR